MKCKECGYITSKILGYHKEQQIFHESSHELENLWKFESKLKNILNDTNIKPATKITMIKTEYTLYKEYEFKGWQNE